MKVYTVHILPAAEDAVLAQARYIAADKPEAAARWLERLWDEMDGLSQFPRRHPVATVESDATGTEIRKLVLGAYLLFYRIDEGKASVEVLHFRHGARLPEQD